jgi:hypothetical protein
MVPQSRAAVGVAPILGFVSVLVSMGATFHSPQNADFSGFCNCHVSYKTLANVSFRQDEPLVGYLWGRGFYEFKNQQFMGNTLSNCRESPMNPPRIRWYARRAP